MPLTPLPFAEHPNLHVPLWFLRHQVDGQAAPVYPRTVPLSFMES